ncbi:MAG: GNAT family N-acetyltransferase [Bacteroidetes bacterium]|nr:GNAT family N-acetyltransferase [Bacteroidota bacterium]MBK9800411.1 GNAT family N-acetyltransferase [Bacteroidota bacterium]
MKIHIRRATTSDAAIVALLARITFREAFGFVWTNESVLRNYLATTFSVSKIFTSIQKENNVFWIAFADDLPIGYAKLKKWCPYEKISDPAPAQLQKIYVLNDFIGKTIGEKLQNELFVEVEKRKIKTLWLAVWDGNDKAIRFYERHGFRKETKYHYDFESMSFDYEVMVKNFK